MTTNLLNNLSNVLKKGPSETQKNPLSCEALTRENRIGLKSYLHRTLMLLFAVLVMSIANIGTACGADFTISEIVASGGTTKSNVKVSSSETSTTSSKKRCSSITSTNAVNIDGSANANYNTEYVEVQATSGTLSSLSVNIRGNSDGTATFAAVFWTGNASGTCDSYSTPTYLNRTSSDCDATVSIDLPANTKTVRLYRRVCISKSDNKTFASSNKTDVASGSTFNVFGITATASAGASGKNIYLKPNGIWDTADPAARFAAYYWKSSNGGDNGWVDFASYNACTPCFKATIPSGYDKVILCRMDGSKAANNWDNRWNQTLDQTVPTGNDTCFTISSINECTGGKSCGSWGTYTAPTYTMSYAANSGSGSMSSQTGIACGTDKATTANAFTRDGYSFTGWKADVDVKVGGSTKTAGTLLADGVTIQDISSNITLTAQWEEEVTYTVTYSLNGGKYNGSSTAPTQAAVASGTEITLPSLTPTKEGYVFASWKCSVGNTYHWESYSYTMTAANTTFTAQWVAAASLVSGTLYYTADIVPLSLNDAISATNQYAKGISSNGVFTSLGNPLRTSNSDGTMEINKKDKQTVDGYNFYDHMWFKGGPEKSGVVPSSRAVKFTIPSAGTLSIYCTRGDRILLSNGTTAKTLTSNTSGNIIRRDTTITAGTYYLYANNSGTSLAGMKFVQSCTAPSALAATIPTAKGATLTVTDANDVNNYEFYVSTSSSAPGAGSTATHSVSSAKSLTITNLVAGTQYYAWARSVCGVSNKSGWTALTGNTFTTSTVTVTHTLTNVTKTSGEESAGGSDYTAVFTASTGYSMPNPTVTIGGNAATIVTDYTWSVEGAVGTITIPANKINGNIVITLNSVPSAPSSAVISGTYHYFPGENISLTCTPSGNNGPTTYQWYKGGKSDEDNLIDGATSATYTKNSCTFDDAGSYYCKVTCNATSIWAVTNSHENYDVKILRLYVNGSKGGDPYGNVDFEKVNSTTATASISLGSNWTYGFNIADGCGHYYGNSGTMQYNSYGPWVTNQNGVDCGLTTTNAATYVFTINYSNLEMIETTVTFPSGNQTSGKVIYFDNNDLQWENVYYRIGKNDHVQSAAMTKVYGTANLYQYTTPTYNNFAGWHITNAAGATGSYSVYNTKNGTAITEATAFEGAAVTQAAVTVTPTSSHATGETSDNNNCEFYTYGITTGMKTQNVAISDYSNGTITVNYVNTSNEAATLTSGNADLAHSVILTSITAVPNTGYDASAITINGGAYSANYVVTGATTIAASFTPHVYSITYLDQGGSAFSGTHVDSPNAHPTTHTYATATTLNSATKTGYTFGGWFTNSACTGDAVASLGATAYSADITLYAKWTALPLVTWTMNLNTGDWGAASTSTSDGTNISSIGTSRTDGGSGNYTSATAKVKLASDEVTDSSEPSESANFTFSIANTKQVEITKLDCKVFNVGGSNDGHTTYKAQISDALGHVYNSTNTVCPEHDATLTSVSFVFGSSKILRGAVTIRVYGWVSGSGDFTDFRMGPDIKFYGTVDDYVCSAPAAPTISGTATYTANGDNISLTASCASGADAGTTYTWYKGADFATAKAAGAIQAAKTSAEGGTSFTKIAFKEDEGTYWCEASNGSGCEAHNSTGYAITVNCPVIGTPTTPTIEDLNATGATLGWDPSGMISGALGYQVSIVVTSTSAEVVAWTSEGITNDRTYTVSGLTEGVGYTFKVRGWSNGCVGSESSVDFTPTTSITYTVTFNSNGGSAVSPITQASEDASIAKPSDPTGTC